MSQDDSEISNLQTQLGYTFKDQSLLIRALTTPGNVNEKKDARSQAALSTLGDSVLGAIIADRSFRDDSTPEQITNCKRQRGRNIALARLAKDLSLELFRHIICSKGEQPKLDSYHLDSTDVSSRLAKGGRTIYANTMEAIIGAIYLDSSYDKAREVVSNWFDRSAR